MLTTEQIKERINLIFMDVESRLWSKKLVTNQEEYINEHSISVIKRLMLKNNRILLCFSQHQVGTLSNVQLSADICIEDEHGFTELVQDVTVEVSQSFTEPTLDYIEKFYENNLGLIKELLEKETDQT